MGQGQNRLTLASACVPDYFSSTALILSAQRTSVDEKGKAADQATRTCLINIPQVVDKQISMDPRLAECFH